MIARLEIKLKIESEKRIGTKSLSFSRRIDGIA